MLWKYVDVMVAWFYVKSKSKTLFVDKILKSGPIFKFDFLFINEIVYMSEIDD